MLPKSAQWLLKPRTTAHWGIKIIRAPWHFRAQLIILLIFKFYRKKNWISVSRVWRIFARPIEFRVYWTNWSRMKNKKFWDSKFWERHSVLVILFKTPHDKTFLRSAAGATVTVIVYVNFGFFFPLAWQNTVMSLNFPCHRNLADGPSVRHRRNSL